jgi:hypothetical protein
MAKRYSKAKVASGTMDEQRAKYPKKLIEAFVKCHNAKYAEAEWEEYAKQSKAFLGKAYDETLERLKLTVQLTGLTYDLVDKVK